MNQPDGTISPEIVAQLSGYSPDELAASYLQAVDGFMKARLAANNASTAREARLADEQGKNYRAWAQYIGSVLAQGQVDAGLRRMGYEEAARIRTHEAEQAGVKFQRDMYYTDDVQAHETFEREGAEQAARELENLKHGNLSERAGFDRETRRMELSMQGGTAIEEARIAAQGLTDAADIRARQAADEARRLEAAEDRKYQHAWDMQQDQQNFQMALESKKSGGGARGGITEQELYKRLQDLQKRPEMVAVSNSGEALGRGFAAYKAPRLDDGYASALSVEVMIHTMGRLMDPSQGVVRHYDAEVIAEIAGWLTNLGAKSHNVGAVVRKIVDAFVAEPTDQKKRISRELSKSLAAKWDQQTTDAVMRLMVSMYNVYVRRALKENLSDIDMAEEFKDTRPMNVDANVMMVNKMLRNYVYLKPVGSKDDPTYKLEFGLPLTDADIAPIKADVESIREGIVGPEIYRVPLVQEMLRRIEGRKGAALTGEEPAPAGTEEGVKGAAPRREESTGTDGAVEKAPVTVVPDDPAVLDEINQAYTRAIAQGVSPQDAIDAIQQRISNFDEFEFDEASGRFIAPSGAPPVEESGSVEGAAPPVEGSGGTETPDVEAGSAPAVEAAEESAEADMEASAEESAEVEDVGKEGRTVSEQADRDRRMGEIIARTNLGRSFMEGINPFASTGVGKAKAVLKEMPDVTEEEFMGAYRRWVERSNYRRTPGGYKARVTHKDGVAISTFFAKRREEAREKAQESSKEEGASDTGADTSPGAERVEEGSAPSEEKVGQGGATAQWLRIKEEERTAPTPRADALFEPYPLSVRDALRRGDMSTAEKMIQDLPLYASRTPEEKYAARDDINFKIDRNRKLAEEMSLDEAHQTFRRQLAKIVASADGADADTKGELAEDLIMLWASFAERVDVARLTEAYLAHLEGAVDAGE